MVKIEYMHAYNINSIIKKLINSLNFINYTLIIMFFNLIIVTHLGGLYSNLF